MSTKEFTTDLIPTRTSLTSGLFRVVNKVTGRFYSGNTTNFVASKKSHFKKLRKNVHSNYLLQRDWIKYGEAAFEYVVEERVEPERDLLIAAHQAVLNQITSEPGFKDRTYNLIFEAVRP